MQAIDLRNTEETAEVLLAFGPFEHFSKVVIDAFALIDQSGRVVKCNQMLSQVLGKKTKAILKASSLNELIEMSVGGETLDVRKFLAQSSPVRFDEVNAKSEAMDAMSLILSCYPFFSSNGTPIGAFILLRDVTAEANLQSKYKVKSEQSITDKLTGMYNRTFFDAMLPGEVNRCKAEEPGSLARSLAILMIDIDHFKKVNDTYGHQAGDFVLASTAKIILAKMRSSDYVCRYGGEEFIAILPGTELAGAARAAEKIRQEIANFVYDLDGTTIPITASFGVAQLNPDKEDGKKTIARADAALYRAKQAGRNRVCIENGDGLIADFTSSAIQPDS